MQSVETTHHLQLAHRYRPWQIVDTATANAQNLRLLGDRQIVLTVNHRFALSNPALLSAPSKKSFSSVNCPILACSAFRSTGAASGATAPPNTPAARSINCLRHSVTWLGCTSCFCAISAMVLPSANA